MSVNATRTKMAFDKSAATLLRDPAAVALSVTTISPSISLSELRTAYWSNFEIPHGVFRVGCVVSDGLFQGSTYTIALLVDDVAAMTDTPTTVGGPYAIVANGYYEFDVDSKTIPLIDTVHVGPGKFLASKMTVAGTPVAITSTANNGGGKVRLLLGSTAGFATGQTRTITGVATGTEANGTFVITVVDATHIDLLTVTFVAGGTGGQFSPQISYGAWIGKCTDA